MHTIQVTSLYSASAEWVWWAVGWGHCVEVLKFCAGDAQVLWSTVKKYISSPVCDLISNINPTWATNSSQSCSWPNNVGAFI